MTFRSAKVEKASVIWPNPPETQSGRLLPEGAGFLVLAVVGWVFSLCEGLAVGFVEVTVLFLVVFLLPLTIGFRDTGVAFGDCFGRLVACFVVCLGVFFVVLVVVERTLDWPMLLLVWLGFVWVFGLLFFFPDFPIFALASVLRPLAPCMIPEMPAETPEVAVSIKLSLTLRTLVTTEPTAPNRPDKNPPELPFVGALEGLGCLSGVTGLIGVLVVVVFSSCIEWSRSRSPWLKPEPSLGGWLWSLRGCWAGGVSGS